MPDNTAVQVINNLDEVRKLVKSRSQDVSFNELADMYKSGELTIRPQYQRMFRWSVGKQSRFIESLALEMPIPPIFVMEIAEGKWELIDGLQRISSYLHFRGVLIAPELDPPIKPGDCLALEECDIVEALNERKFDDLPASIQIRLKRYFVRVEVIRQETAPELRYYLFKRLNTGGEPLSEQEVRNCTIRLLGEKFNDYLCALRENVDFKNCIATMTEDARRRMEDVELVLRFLAFKNYFASFKHDVSDFLTEYMERVTKGPKAGGLDFDYEAEEKLFKRVFSVLSKTMGENTCLRWLGDKYGGGFSMHQYEAMTLGVARQVEKLDPADASKMTALKKKLEGVKISEKFAALTKGGGKNSPGPYKEKIGAVADAIG